jgi:hypothetical protein
MNYSFLACLPRKSTSDQASERIERARRLLLQQMELVADVCSSGDWFRSTFPSFQNWDEWMDDTVFGLHSITRFPHFVGYVVFSLDVGKATAGITERALTCGKPVLYASGSELVSVTGVRRNALDSWSHGWTIHTKDS